MSFRISSFIAEAISEGRTAHGTFKIVCGGTSRAEDRWRGHRGTRSGPEEAVDRLRLQVSAAEAGSPHATKAPLR
jgi:hypothetical protein